jgi:hypothetical protein
VHPGASWCVLVPPGASCCLLVLPGASWCLLVPPGASWCLLVLPPEGYTRCRLAQKYVVSIRIMLLSFTHGLPSAQARAIAPGPRTFAIMCFVPRQCRGRQPSLRWRSLGASAALNPKGSRFGWWRGLQAVRVDSYARSLRRPPAPHTPQSSHFILWREDCVRADCSALLCKP